MNRLTACLSVTLLALVAPPALAQQDAPEPEPFAAGGIPRVPLPDAPIVYDTASGQRIRVVVVADGLTYPWGLAFLPDDSVLVTERLGTLRRISNGALDPNPIAGVPEVFSESPLAGLMDVAVHPDYSENRFVYLTYSKPTDDGSRVALARGRFEGAALSEVRDLFVSEGTTAGGAARLAFAPDGMLYMTVGGAFGGIRSHAQDAANHAGKVLRLRDDGTAPDDNPFAGQEGLAPEVYSLGHRNPMGLAIHPETGAPWASEHGVMGGDEVNIILPGRNYGWPDVSYSREYFGVRGGGAALAGAVRAAGDRVGAVHRALRTGLLYRRPIPRLARRPVRRLADDRTRRPNGPPRADRVQPAGPWSRAANGCWPTSGSASATSSRAPTACCTC